MENKPQILELFPIPLFKITLPSTLSVIVPWLNNQPMNGKVMGVKKFGEISQNTYILNSDECKNLRNIILKYALEFGTNSLGYSYQSYKFSQSWISHKKPTQSHSPHMHSNSLISGVFYYSSSSLESLPITFHKQSPTSINAPLINIDMNEKILTPYSANTLSLHCQPGDLILFPSYLHHSVPENTTNNTRKSLAFNIIPEGGVGHELSLNRLKFN
jgi:uncharacterized protein (TIGR02466 family)